MPKDIHTSRLMIFNFLGTVLAVITFLQGQEIVVANPRLAAGLVAVAGIINMVLRYLTVAPIAPLFPQEPTPPRV